MHSYQENGESFVVEPQFLRDHGMLRSALFGERGDKARLSQYLELT